MAENNMIQNGIEMEINEVNGVMERNIGLPREMWLEILSKLEIIDLWERYGLEEENRNIYVAALQWTKIFEWNMVYKPDLTREDFQQLCDYSINDYIEELRVTYQPRQVQFLDMSKAINIRYIDLRNVELNRFILNIEELRRLKLHNVLLGDGFLLNEILRKNTKLEEIDLKELGVQKIQIKDKIWQNLNIKKLHINEITAFDTLNIIKIQANNLRELSILNMGISVDELYEFNEYHFPNLEILRINIYGNKCGDAAMTFLDNITWLYIEIESLESLMCKLKLFFNPNIRNLERIEIKPINYREKFRNECNQWLACERKMKIANRLIKFGINPTQMIRMLRVSNRFVFNITQ